MITLERTIRTAADPAAAYAYLADFENAVEWDSGTVSCTRTSGDGGPGTVYRNVSRFAGRTVELDYTVEKRSEPVFVIVGRNKTTTSHDTITVRPVPGGSEVVYHAEFTFTGIIGIIAPVVKPLLERLGDETEKTLRTALERLAASSR